MRVDFRSRRSARGLRGLGAGMAQVHLLAELVDKIDELIDHVSSPKKVVKDAAGEIVGVEAD